MGLAYRNLDQDTRNLMVEEIQLDLAGTGLYVSNYLNEVGAQQWAPLTSEAAQIGNDDTLAAALASGCIKSHVERRKPKGGFTTVAVPYTAPQTLAEAQFNMYYMRALARRAIAEGLSLVVYRAKETSQHRSTSDAMLGSTIDAELVIEELRRTKGVEPSIQIPLPNSGLSVLLA